MDIKKIKAIIDLVQQSGVAELEIIEGEEALKIKTNSSTNHSAAITTQVVHQGDLAKHSQFSGVASAGLTINEPLIEELDSNNIFNSPMVGTFYLAATPKASPFVEVNKVVKVGDTLCIIEAMKLMNQIEIEYPGVIEKILVEDGHPVEYGQPLFVIKRT